MNTKFLIVNEQAELICNQRMLVNVKTENLNSWEIAEYSDQLEKKIEKLLLTKRLTGNPEKTNNLLLHLESVNSVSQEMEQVEKNVYILDGAVLTYCGDNILVKINGVITQYDRVWGSNMNSIWRSYGGLIVQTLDNNFQILGYELYKKTLRLDYFSQQQLNNFNGWKCIQYLQPYIESVLNTSQTFISNRFESIKGRDQATKNIQLFAESTD